ncbi:MAG TPA: hydroxymethylpyrimidine/phosphomethylpyrimidine kinase [Vulgatibacter sp.]|nr:hydroxymethylpyrimidine/phosphomethylpyrimidine kinase [Vulgatibacter sp.]
MSGAGSGPGRGATAAGVLVLAGLDPSGGAGLLADEEAIRAAGARPFLCATALTFQSERRVHGWDPVAPSSVKAQVRALLDDGAGIRAVKVGMLGGAAGVVGELRAHPDLRDLPWVIDPVLASTSGAPLVEGGARAYDRLLPGAVVTPNAGEAAALSGLPVPRDETELLRCAEAIVDRGARAVIAKGGHLAAEPTDWVVGAEGALRLPGERLAGSRRGTGCRLASFVAARLALGDPLPAAASAAKSFVTGYLGSR